MDYHTETDADAGPSSKAAAVVATTSTTTTSTTVPAASSLASTMATTTITTKVGSWSLNKSKVKKLGIKSSLLQALNKLKTTTTTAAGTNRVIYVFVIFFSQFSFE